jgi:hypothetical protein
MRYRGLPFSSNPRFDITPSRQFAMLLNQTNSPGLKRYFPFGSLSSICSLVLVVMAKPGWNVGLACGCACVWTPSVKCQHGQHVTVAVTYFLLQLMPLELA